MPGHIVLSNTTWKILHDYLQQDRARLIKAYGAEDAGPLFLSESNHNAGQPISKWSVTKIFDEIREALGLPQLTPHKLRHLMLTHLMDYGLDLYEVSLYARHRSTASTEIYLHIADAKLASPRDPHPRAAMEPLSLSFQRAGDAGGGSQCHELTGWLTPSQKSLAAFACPLSLPIILTAPLCSAKRNAEALRICSSLLPRAILSLTVKPAC
jgi:Phage integrase family